MNTNAENHVAPHSISSSTLETKSEPTVIDVSPPANAAIEMLAQAIGHTPSTLPQALVNEIEYYKNRSVAYQEKSRQHSEESLRLERFASALVEQATLYRAEARRLGECDQLAEEANYSEKAVKAILGYYLSWFGALEKGMNDEVGTIEARLSFIEENPEGEHPIGDSFKLNCELECMFRLLARLNRAFNGCAHRLSELKAEEKQCVKKVVALFWDCFHLESCVLDQEAVGLRQDVDWHFGMSQHLRRLAVLSDELSDMWNEAERVTSAEHRAEMDQAIAFMVNAIKEEEEAQDNWINANSYRKQYNCKVDGVRPPIAPNSPDIRMSTDQQGPSAQYDEVPERGTLHEKVRYELKALRVKEMLERLSARKKQWDALQSARKARIVWRSAIYKNVGTVTSRLITLPITDR